MVACSQWISSALDEGRAFFAALGELQEAEGNLATLAPEPDDVEDPLAGALAPACADVARKRAAARRHLVDLAKALSRIPGRRRALGACARIERAMGLGVRRHADEEQLGAALRELEADATLLDLEAAPRVDSQRDTAPPSPPLMPTFGDAR